MSQNNPYIQSLHPTIFVIFGITGDLASRKLLPALLTLYSKSLLPNKFLIVGFSRRLFNKEEFREYIRERLNISPGQFPEEVVKHFLDHIVYEQGIFDDPASYMRLGERLKNTDDLWGQCSNKLFHLSVPPRLYEVVLTHIASSGLSQACDDGSGWTKILIEKPFGDDIDMAISLDKLLGKLFKEEQIFRIDHYLAKEALQNILTFRFSNNMFESLWNGNHIEKVHIKLYESAGLSGRGNFYDSIGAIKDVGQNHMLVMLSMIAMDSPKKINAINIRNERAKVLSRLHPITTKSLSKNIIRGQYIGYNDESGINKNSTTETYFRIRAHIDSPRWKGVPFFLESGKALSQTKSEIDIYFRSQDGSDEQNILTFRIQPDEGIRIKFFVKPPGYEWLTEPKTLKFKYADVPSFHDMPNDYERLLHDAFIGDQTLFASTREIMASWKFVTPILKNLDKIPLIKYEKGAKEVGE